MDPMDPLTKLKLWRELHDDRAALIEQARDEGILWRDIVDASGLSPAMAKRLLQQRREARED